MEATSRQIFVFIILGMIFYMLYMSGFMVVSAKRAVVFIGNLLELMMANNTIFTQNKFQNNEGGEKWNREYFWKCYT